MKRCNVVGPASGSRGAYWMSLFIVARSMNSEAMDSGSLARHLRKEFL